MKNLCLIEKIEENSMPLGEIAIASWGARGVPAKEFHLSKPIESYEDLCKKMIKGSNVSRYEIDYDGKWLLYDPNGRYKKLYRPAFPELFENNKIVVSEVTGKKGLVAAFDNDGYYTDHSLSCLILKYNLKDKDSTFLNRRKIKILGSQIEESKKYNLKFILGCINSEINNFYYQVLLGYELNVCPELIEKLRIPIVEKEEQEKVIELVDRIIYLNKCKLLLENSFDNVLKQLKFVFKKNMSYFYPNNSIDFSINLVESDITDNKKIDYFDCGINENYLTIINQNNDIICKIKFEDKELLLFFYYSINKFSNETNKRKFDEILEVIEIPVTGNNKIENKNKMKRVINVMQDWYNNNEIFKKF
jgi:hypothetical protein